MNTAVCLRPKTEDLWRTAVAYLPEQDKAYYLESPNRVQSIAELLQLTNNAKEQCKQRVWRFQRKSGEEVIVRDVLAKVARWIDHFKEVGDIVVQYDPTHAALPWAGVRFVLQICVDYFETQDFLLEKIPLIAEQICRCTLMETLLVPSPSAAAAEFKRALVTLYARILAYLARVKEYFHKTTRRQVLQSAKLMSSKFESAFTAITVAQTDVERCLQMASVQEQLDRLTGLKDAFMKFEAPMNRWNQELANITDTLDRSKRREILLWISREPYLEHHVRERENFLEGTGSWFLSHPIFQKWKEESASSILWLHGIPGSGKSKLTSLVIEDARQAYQRRQAPPPAFFYCSRNPAEPERSDPAKIIASIVRQLSSVGSGNSLLQPSIAAYRSHEEQAFAAGSLRLPDSRRLLLQLLAEYPTATIIIDALDECRADTRRQLLDCLDNILCKSSTLVKIFVSSRDDDDIVSQLQNYPSLTLSSELNSEDINSFVTSQMNNLVQNGEILRSSGRKDELRHKIVQVVSDGAQGMFRWASLQLNALCKSKSDDAVLERLGRLPDTLEKLYQELVNEIQAYSAEADRRYAANAFAWMLCSHRRLGLTEFLTAVSTIPGQLTTTLNKDQILDLCRNLIVFDSTLDSFRFAHLSVREFLETKEEYSSPTINYLAAECCLTSLMASKETNMSNNGLTMDSYTIRCQTNYLHSYAKAYWATHCQDAVDKRRHGHLRAILELFMSGTGRDSPFGIWTRQIGSTANSIQYHDRSLSQRLLNCKSTDTSSLFVASAFNFAEFILVQLQEDAPIENWKSTKCVVLAARYGSLEVLSALLEVQRVQITEDAVKEAAGNEESGKEVMALLLEERGDQVQITEDVVKAAAGNEGSGKEVMALMLVKRHHEVVTNLNETVYMIAAASGQHGVIDLVSQYNGLSIRRDECVDIATFYHASKIGDLPTIRQLLYRGVSPDLKNIRGITPLSTAARWGHRHIVECLVQNGKVDINSTSISGRPPIFWPAAQGDVKVVEILVGAGANLNIQDEDGETALSMARKNGHTKVVQVLMGL